MPLRLTDSGGTASWTGLQPAVTEVTAGLIEGDVFTDTSHGSVATPERLPASRRSHRIRGEKKKKNDAGSQVDRQGSILKRSHLNISRL